MSEQLRPCTTHELKIWPTFFNAVLDGTKTFELRHDDRDYKVGDTLILKEWTDVQKYTGREITKIVSYVLRNNKMLNDAVCLGLVPSRTPDVEKLLDKLGDVSLAWNEQKQINAELVRLVKCLVENDPDDLISDAGHTVLELWRHDAKAALKLAGVE